MAVIPLCLRINTDKHKDVSSNTTTNLTATQLHVSAHCWFWCGPKHVAALQQSEVVLVCQFSTHSGNMYSTWFHVAVSHAGHVHPCTRMTREDGGANDLHTRGYATENENTL
jgi:hypothetical protein